MRKPKILCVGDPVGSLMTEGYLHFFAGDKAEVCRLAHPQEDAHALVAPIMAEDNIEVSGPGVSCPKEGEAISVDFLLSIGYSEEVPASPLFVKCGKHVHFAVALQWPALDGVDDDTQLRHYFRQVREVVKKHTLKFIGRELSGNTALLGSWSDEMGFGPRRG